MRCGIPNVTIATDNRFEAVRYLSKVLCKSGGADVIAAFEVFSKRF